LGTSLTTDEMWDTLKSIGRGINLGSTSGLLGGPVDMATMLLNNPGLLHPGLLGVQGLGIKDPVGGSKWIEQKLQNLGLLPQRQGNWQEGVGELASTFINPMTAAAVAGPKLYAAEQRAIENAMAPTTLNKQAGAIVWHGSPHKFDKFDSSKIGTGEGAQAYGHGLYLAESPDVAKSYMGAGTSKGGAAFENRLSKMMERAQDAGRYGEAGALEELLVNRNPAMARTKFSVSNGYSPETVSQAHKVIAQFEDKFQPSGLYKVDLPDSAIARMLDWDKPLSQQAPAVQAAYKKYLKSPQASEYAKSWTRYKDGMRLDQAEPLLKNPGGENLYKNAFPSREAANQWAFENGIPGIRYLDGGSRGAGSGTSNFVVFPGNEDLLRILERNGQPIGLLGR
jgi:hypothetical protein